MSHLAPRQFYNDFLEGKIDKSSLIDYLISLIDKSNGENLRIDAIKSLSKLGPRSDFYFKFMENLLISDDNNVIKAYAIKSLIKNFPNRAFKPIHWALENVEWESINNHQKIGIGSILKDLRNINHPKLNALLDLKEHVVFHDEIYLVNNKILKLNNLNITNINQIERLDKLSNLKELYLSGNTICQIIGLENLTKLKILDLSHNKIKKIQGLDTFLDLNQLYLNNNEIIHLSGLDKLINLTYLNLDSNKILEIDGLNHNEHLRTLYLSHNSIIEIKNLNTLTSLFFLALNHNKIKEIKGLDNLINLTILRLTYNEIMEINGLDNLKKLTTLNLAHNKIKFITEPDVPFLYFFNLAHNQIPEQNLIHFYKTHSIFTYFLFSK